jgi:hypothetical protein
MLDVLVTAGVLQPTPLKRISSRDLEQDSEKGENMISLLRAEITIGDYLTSNTNHSGI